METKQVEANKITFEGASVEIEDVSGVTHAFAGYMERVWIDDDGSTYFLVSQANALVDWQVHVVRFPDR